MSLKCCQGIHAEKSKYLNDKKFRALVSCIFFPFRYQHGLNGSINEC